MVLLFTGLVNHAKILASFVPVGAEPLTVYLRLMVFHASVVFLIRKELSFILRSVGVPVEASISKPTGHPTIIEL